jgi:hypothetical protein
MKQILNYIGSYFREQDKRVIAVVTLFTALLIFLNYRLGIDDKVSGTSGFFTKFNGRYIIFLIAFILPYFVYVFFTKKNYFSSYAFLLLVLLAPAIFAVKTSLSFDIKLAMDATKNNYWQYIVYWPALLLIVIVILFFLWNFFDSNQPFYGIKTKGINWKPYWFMLLLMIPLVAAASTQPDFLSMYPKLTAITDGDKVSTWKKILFELSYGSDFITIEVFFRGFLVLAFIKWAGKDAILPMACFYCTIHFGKPLGECISSYFGGLLLGIVVYHTRSIFGGLMVHLGIAWLMELGGYIGNAYL